MAQRPKIPIRLPASAALRFVLLWARKPLARQANLTKSIATPRLLKSLQRPRSISARPLSTVPRCSTDSLPRALRRTVDNVAPSASFRNGCVMEQLTLGVFLQAPATAFAARWLPAACRRASGRRWRWETAAGLKFHRACGRPSGCCKSLTALQRWADPASSYPSQSPVVPRRRAASAELAVTTR